MVVWDMDTGLCKLYACFSLCGLHIQTSRTNFVSGNATLPAGAVAYTYSSSRFGRGVATNLTSFHCYGNESHLLNCTHSVTSSCSRDYTAGVLCYGDVVPGLLIGLIDHIHYTRLLFIKCA